LPPHHGLTLADRNGHEYSPRLKGFNHFGKTGC